MSYTNQSAGALKSKEKNCEEMVALGWDLSLPVPTH